MASSVTVVGVNRLSMANAIRLGLEKNPYEAPTIMLHKTISTYLETNLAGYEISDAF